jgi:formylglycine-generating enzyme required for sulfatase activity
LRWLPTSQHEPSPGSVAQYCDVLEGAVAAEAERRSKVRRFNPNPLETFRDKLEVNREGPLMVALPAGSFSMGAAPGERGFIDREGPRHKVSVLAFAISKFEITFDEYALFAAATKKKPPKDKSWGRGVRPVIYVSWNDAQAYVAWLSEESGAQYRLPSEAEWEYAARGGEAMANCKECGSRWDGTQTAPVGSFPANPFGLHDMSGNVWEWTADCWHANYNNAPSDGRVWEDAANGDCNERVFRGGSWDQFPNQLRSSDRFKVAPKRTNDNLGFRVARTLGE